MKTYTINIGRNNNLIADRCQVLSSFNDMLTLAGMKLGKVNSIRMDGEYTDGVEPTFVAEFEAEDMFNIHTLLGLCTIVYTQECIAISSNDREWNELRYNPLFEGDKMKFNYDYFLWVE